MGDIFRKVQLCGLTDNGDRLGCVDAEALIDTGASTTLISSGIAKKLRGGVIRDMLRIEGRSIPIKIVGAQLDEPHCQFRVLTAGFDDALISRAGNGPSGKPVEVILGHDYLQRQDITLRYNGAKSEVSCAAPKKAKRRHK